MQIYSNYFNIFIYNPDEEILLIYKYTNTSGEDDVFVQGEVYSRFRKYELGLMAGAGMKYNINSNSYLLFTGGYEYRMPAARAGFFYEYK